MRILCFGISLFIFSFPVCAQAQHDSPSPVKAEAARAVSEATRIEVDQDANVIRFFIEGQEAVRIDARGLHVREDIRYRGTIKDTGSQADAFADSDEKPEGEGE
jgi:hypothetical protein